MFFFFPRIFQPRRSVECGDVIVKETAKLLRSCFCQTFFFYRLSVVCCSRVSAQAHAVPFEAHSDTLVSVSMLTLRILGLHDVATEKFGLWRLRSKPRMSVTPRAFT